MLIFLSNRLINAKEAISYCFLRTSDLYLKGQFIITSRQNGEGVKLTVTRCDIGKDDKIGI